ncbi:MAG: thioredoxin domain-containing protein [Candidatus Dojkabacteria bacterium]|nr:thioredoxin domain-containing protein [Candidatus Dojkabacteria bacterium]
MPKKKTKKSSGDIVINLDNFAIPIAIVVAGLLIAVGIFVSNKTKSTDTNTKGETVAETESGEFPSATTTIDDDPYIGDRSKVKVAVVEFSDFQCGYCGRHAQQVFPVIKEKYIDTGKVIYVFRDFQFFEGLSTDAGMGGQCLYELTKSSDKFAEYHTQIFGLESKDDVFALAKKLGINESSFKKCMDEERYADELDKDMADGQAAGISGTPGFVVGVLKEDGTVEGKLIKGAYPIESFDQIIEEMLAK